APLEAGLDGAQRVHERVVAAEALDGLVAVEPLALGEAAEGLGPADVLVDDAGVAGPPPPERLDVTAGHAADVRVGHAPEADGGRPPPLRIDDGLEPVHLLAERLRRQPLHPAVYRGVDDEAVGVGVVAV